jgi:hypothetical protein
MMRAVEIAGHAARLIASNRAQTHGDMVAVHAAIAAIWNGILSAAGKAPARPLDAHDAANLMEGLKIARRYAGKLNVDDYVDGAGYAAIAGELAQRAAADQELQEKVARRERIERGALR